MWTSGLVIFALTYSVSCACPWKDCNYWETDLRYEIDEALLNAKDNSPVSEYAKQPGFEKELPGFHFMFWWVPVPVTWYVRDGYVWNLGSLQRKDYDSLEKCTLTSDSGVLLKNTLEGTLSYDMLQEHFDYTSIKFPYWTVESSTEPTGQYEFRFKYTVEYNSTFCELTDINWETSKGNYVMSWMSWLFARLFTFDVPEEHIRQIKGQIHLYFDTYVVKAWCTKFRGN